MEQDNNSALCCMSAAFMGEEEIEGQGGVMMSSSNIN